jgi:Holliday junction resolvase RusA-like endonuclease
MTLCNRPGYTKAVLDALTTLGVWKDDALVACMTVRKRYGERPGCAITITTLTTNPPKTPRNDK